MASKRRDSGHSVMPPWKNWKLGLFQPLPDKAGRRNHTSPCLNCIYTLTVIHLSDMPLTDIHYPDKSDTSVFAVSSIGSTGTYNLNRPEVNLPRDSWS
ncbi:hypothetical protein J6590_048374 [Homalodisca vitripennis]|nr:hypothetical protein J6590_048374 [Homalodisca vitripennis]